MVQHSRVRCTALPPKVAAPEYEDKMSDNPHRHRRAQVSSIPDNHVLGGLKHKVTSFHFSATLVFAFGLTSQARQLDACRNCDPTWHNLQWMSVRYRHR